jgi:formate dehydrogenase subunit beta
VGEIKREIGIDNNMTPDELKAMPSGERWRRWSNEFTRCLKCYGCRDICPVCFCKECSLEHPDVVTPGRLPVEVPMFHLTRAVHMAGRCIDCGLCEQACPSDIPLRLLYSEVNGIMDKMFGFRAGEKAEQSQLSFLDLLPQETETELKLNKGAA